ncbi:MAG: prephenate dehydratase [Mobiluncus porci]|uniref:Prephenate dehydratase n=1 Tax=Mobiluncus porci TaxID=2652278 RepID=A0A7K0K5C5_9ACTO|nr:MULTISPECIES: prephenate dehydratase [Mobiluncus]MCI6585256.1 prephenate dehydratase [Mobiluncus sp.]MDD7541110.1 prephenate dehydratase [Mobiluncus porci]MDY5747569.1 prephenate dehydratase [Mobiluncus porci]MST50636.1 prephenate dehydratase [Mobiluncus porci]
MSPTSSPVSPLPGPAVTGSLRIAFLGPFGTFCEQAARQILPADAELKPATGVESALLMVRTGEADRAVVPIENSVEGGVNATLDTLAHGQPLTIVGEILVPIAFSLMVRPDSDLELNDLQRIGTHSHAWAQTRDWVTANVGPAVSHIPTTSTAEAAKLLMEDPDCGYDAVLCSAVSAVQYGGRVLADGIADNPDAQTRFVLVSPPGSIPAPTGADKTTVQVALPGNESGALLSMLEQFSARGVNLSRIESRPVGGHFDRYAFSIDLEGHVSEERVKAALVGLHRTCPEVRFLGSYPRVDRMRTQIQRGTANVDFATARAWLDEVLAGRAV